MRDAVACCSPSCQSPALGLFPDLNESPVKPAPGHELVVGTPLNDAAVLHHQDLVRALDGGQPMGDGKDGFPLCQSGQSLLNQVLILRVYAGGRFIKDDDRASFKIARAMEMRCFSPPERVEPPSPITVS